MSSKRMVEELSLSIIAHSQSYKLQRLSEDRDIFANKQYLVSFSLGT